MTLWFELLKPDRNVKSITMGSKVIVNNTQPHRKLNLQRYNMQSAVIKYTIIKLALNLFFIIFISSGYYAIVFQII